MPTPNILSNLLLGYEQGQQNRERSRLQQLDQSNRDRQLGMQERQLGMQEQQFSDQQKAKRLDEIASGAFAADTPQKWEAFKQTWKAQGHTLDPSEEPFSARDIIINQAMGWKEKLNQQNIDRNFTQQKTQSDRSYDLQNRELTETKRFHDASLAAKNAPPVPLTPEQRAAYEKNGYMEPSGTVHLPASNQDPESFKNVTTIRKEIQDLPSYKSYSAALPIYQTMVDASQRDSKAADLNMVYGLAKIYDPTSVVREGETVMVRDTASLPDWLVGTINGLNGGARLQPGTRTAMMQEAKSRIDAYKSAFDTNMGQYKGLASRYNINEQDIMPVMPELAQTPAQSGAGTTKSGIQFKVLP